MIKTLTYSVTFPTNGISLSGTIDFQPGLTAVTGGNGEGKTFGYVEMPRYMLFGKKALRGVASHYKTLTGKMVVEIAGQDYTIERTPKAESLKDHEGNVLAVGTEAVNAAIQRLLGMNLDMFDVICAAVQKESDRLSKMSPTPRRALIDKLAGLTGNEEVEKACKDEAAGLAREAEGMRFGLAEPAEPLKPEDYEPSTKLGEQVAAASATLAERRRLQQVIDAVGAAPIAPAVPPSAAEIDALVTHERERVEREAEVRAAARQLASIPEAKDTAEELNAAEALNAWWELSNARGAEPTMTRAEIEAWQTYFEKKAVADRLADVEVECPDCSHKFCPGHEVVERPAGEEPTATKLRKELEALDRWAKPLPEKPFGPDRSAQQIAAGRAALEQQDLRKELEAKLDQPGLDDHSADLNAARRAEAAWAEYLRQDRDFQERAARGAEAQVELDKLPVVAQQDVDALNRRNTAASIYEAHLDNYAAAVEAYRNKVSEIEDRVKRAEDFKLGAKKLAETRRQFKAHLGPSVSRIASALIYEMTGGVLSSVIVDEDMNITVDGQDISTLSGAGSTVANLAVRLALGQTLTKSILPIFIADEADSDMEESRAEYTMQCLGNLEKHLKQIIVITHKPVTFTDQIISLGSNV